MTMLQNKDEWFAEIRVSMYLLIKKSSTKEESLLIWVKSNTHFIMNKKWKQEEKGANLTLHVRRYGIIPVDRREMIMNKIRETQA